MGAILRYFQTDIKREIYAAWNARLKNVLAVLPTGTGKTVVFSDILAEHLGASCAIAHRQELVSQISTALAREGVYHRIIGPNSVVKLCVNLHMSELGRSFFDPQARCAVAGVDTLIRRKEQLGPWLQDVTLWVMDEAHHVLKKNKWGLAVEMFPNAKGLGVTATPTRTDGYGLGRDFDGVFDALLVGLEMRDAINQGYLTDYRIFAPPSNLDLSTVSISASTGDYSRVKMVAAVKKSQIIGDIVAHYLRIAPNKLGVSFLPDVETAVNTANKFNTAGIPAAVVSAKTPASERISTLRKFKNRELLQLVNVDLFGEGFDLPAVEVVSFGRPTQSFSLYCQQFGRVLRLMLLADYLKNWDAYDLNQRLSIIAASTKPTGIIIDHVNNCLKHGLPDTLKQWSLTRREKRTNNGTPLLKICQLCTAAYERFLTACPCCGHIPEPSLRSGPEFVDGNLQELDAATLAKMRGDIATIDRNAEDYRAELAAKGAPIIGQMAHVKRHVKRQETQATLRDSIAWWAGFQRAAGRSDPESYKRFYLKFGLDVLTAQTLNTADALKLTERVNLEIAKIN